MQKLEICKILRQDLNVVGAGRTDTGVHAKQMFAHFETVEDIDCQQLTFRLNRFLPAAIAIQKIFPVTGDAHTRFSAISRSYEYKIATEKDPFKGAWSWLIEQPLNLDVMNECAQLLLGEQDFSAFSKSGTQTETNLCNVTEAFFVEGGGLIVFHISANRFLRNMVRAIVGTLVEVGQNKMDKQRFLEVIENKSRSLAGTSAPAKGLYLTKVIYPESIQLNG